MISNEIVKARGLYLISPMRNMRNLTLTIPRSLGLMNETLWLYMVDLALLSLMGIVLCYLLKRDISQGVQILFVAGV